MMNKRKISREGFTMIEVMVAVFLVAVGLVAVLSLFGIGVRQSTMNKNNLIAALLAQEGVELVRNIRDTNWINGLSDSFDGIGSGNCRADASDFENLDCSKSNFKLSYDDSFYYHGSPSSSKETIFSRKIIIENAASGEQKIVTSVVIWGEDFPTGDVDEKNCNSANECAFSKISLTKWTQE